MKLPTDIEKIQVAQTEIEKQTDYDVDFKREFIVGKVDKSEYQWVATSLTIDDKPNREDEQARIQVRGGRVEPFREISGAPIGPHRVWLKSENIPGLAMSRSIGDFVAQTVGVIPEPEFYEKTLTHHDKFLILASDGVWEFITNEQAVKMVVPFWKKNDPKGACEMLVAKSVAHWQKEDEVIDDITAQVIFLEIPKE